VETRRNHCLVFLSAAVIIGLAILLIAIANTPGRIEHVTWSKLGPTNVKIFEAQLKTALPRGVPKKQVVAYLIQENIPFSYFANDEKSIRIFGRDAAPRKLIILNGDMFVHVDFDKDERVEDVEFHFLYK
jgi:hypothetical protein